MDYVDRRVVEVIGMANWIEKCNGSLSSSEKMGPKKKKTTVVAAAASFQEEERDGTTTGPDGRFV
jgi:hypothetical protein